MSENELHSPDLGIRQNTGGGGIEWDPMLASWCLQVFVGKTDKCKRPLSGRIT